MHQLEISALRLCALNDRFGVDDSSIPLGFPRLAYLHLSNDGLLEERRRWSCITYHITDAGRAALAASEEE